MSRRRPLPLELPAAFTVQTAREFGITRRRLRDPALSRPFRGARSLPNAENSATDGLGDEEWWSIRAREIDRAVLDYLPIMPAHAFLCGPTAAHFWGMPVPQRIDATLHIGVWRPRTAPVRPGIRGHQFSIGMVRTVHVDDIRLTDPASTWATLGGMLREDELVAAADAAIHIPRYPGGFQPVTETALASREDLQQHADRKGRPGAPRLRSALELARTGSASPPETQIRLILHHAGMPEPVLDYDVYSESGRFLGCSELAYPELKIAIEYESDGHLTRAQLQRDIDKYHDYAQAGWNTVRLTSTHVYVAPQETLRRVRAARASASRYR